MLPVQFTATYFGHPYSSKQNFNEILLQVEHVHHQSISAKVTFLSVFLCRYVILWQHFVHFISNKKV